MIKKYKEFVYYGDYSYHLVSKVTVRCSIAHVYYLMIEAATAQVRINLKSPCKLRTPSYASQRVIPKRDSRIVNMLAFISVSCCVLFKSMPQAVMSSLLRRQSHFIPLQCQLLRCLTSSKHERHSQKISSFLSCQDA